MVIIILSFELVSTVYPQYKNLRFEHYKVEDGLTQNTITDIVQDNKGFIWIATEDGLNKYDGYNFTQFRHRNDNPSSLSSNFIIKLFYDSSDNLWILPRSDDGICRHLYNDKFEKILFYENDSTLAGNRIAQVIEDSRKNLWLKSQRGDSLYGIIRYNLDSGKYNIYRKMFTESGESKPLRIIMLLYKQGKLAAYYDKGVCVLDNKTNRFVDKNPVGENIYDAEFYDENNIIFLTNKGLYNYSFRKNENSLLTSFNPELMGIMQIQTIDSFKNIWISMLGKGLLKYTNKNDQTLFNHSNSPLDERIKVESAYLNRENIWFATRGSGIMVYSERDNNFTSVQHDDINAESISGNFIRNVYKSSEGILWILTEQEGLNKLDYSKNKFIHIKESFTGSGSISSNNIRSLCKYGDNYLLAGTRGGGLNLINETTLEVVIKPVFLAGKQIHNIESICKESETLYWIGTKDNGLLLLNINSGETSKHIQNINGSFAINYIRDIIKDSEGNVWAAGWGGLIKINEGDYSYKVITTSENKKILDSIDVNFCLIEDSDGNILAGSEGGVTKYNKRGVILGRLKAVAGNINSLSHHTVFSLYEDKEKKLWIGTFGGGLNLYDPGEKKFECFRIEDGLPNDIVYSIAEDDNNFLWLSTNNKLCRFNPVDKSIINYGVNDGLPGNSFSFGAYLNYKSIFYYGTQKGVVKFNPDELISPEPPKIYLSDLYVLNKRRDFNRALNNIKEVELLHSDYTFSIHYTALNYSNSDKINYAYRLTEIHDDWIECGKERSATFSSLPPGEYKFEVKAIIPGADEFNTAGIKIKILPAFWQTYWFNALVILSILGVIYVAYRYRLIHLRKLESTRLQIAQDLHDEIGSNLGSITVLSSMVSKQKIDEDKKLNYLNSIKETAFKTADSMRDIVWFIKPENDNAEMILNKMIDFTSKILTEIKYNFHIDKNAFTDKLQLNLRRNIYLIYKEIINNISKHAGASNVSIRMETYGQKFLLTIEDDGCGFDINHESFGSGLSNIMRRAEEIGATAEFSDGKYSGTIFKLSVNIL